MLLHILYCCSEKKSFSNDNYVATECFIFLLFVFGMNEQYFPIHVTFLLLEFAHGTSGYSHTNLPEYSIVISHFWHSKNPLWCNMCGEKVRRSWSVSIDKFYKILHFIWWLEFLQKPLLMISPPVLSIATNVLFNMSGCSSILKTTARSSENDLLQGKVVSYGQQKKLFNIKCFTSINFAYYCDKLIFYLMCFEGTIATHFWNSHNHTTIVYFLANSPVISLHMHFSHMAV